MAFTTSGRRVFASASIPALSMAAGGLLVVILAGCSSSAGLAPVSGKVTLDGKPLADAHVAFQPMAGSKMPKSAGSFGVTNENGDFTLRTFDDERPGAAVGSHRVLINLKRANTDDAPPRTPPKRLPERYNVQSELNFEVKPGGTSEANFDLKSRD